jgi:hypothetical protein
MWVPTIDVHQHLWPAELVEMLAARKAPPRLRGSLLELPGRDAAETDLAVHDLDRRLGLLDRSGIDVAVVSFPLTLGIEQLPPDDASALADAYDRGILELATASGGRIVPLAAGSALDGFAGAAVVAGALGSLDELALRLDELERRGRFLFVHPGQGAPPPEGAPPWWSSVVDHTAQMQAAYAAWLAHGVERWPSLVVVFAILAGGAPFQLERLGSWGIAGRDALQPNVFFETSSYGNRALELCLSTLGVGQLLFGSNVPVLDPEPMLGAVRGFGDAVADALCNTNPSRLLP